MSRSSKIAFILRGKVDGIDLSPATIGLSRFNDFNAQVEEFIAGSTRTKLDDVQIEITQGSYRLLVSLPPIIHSSVRSDLQVLSRQDSLGEIDPKRQDIIARWQARSKQSSTWVYSIAPEDTDIPRIEVSRDSDYRIGSIEPWVSVEKYLLGEVVDMGGVQKANVHLKLSDTGKTIILGTTQGYLQDQLENRLYHKVLVHVRADQHHKTRDLRNIQLISFLDYAPVYDEVALDAFAEKGIEAWSTIPDAAGWVRQLRGEG